MGAVQEPSKDVSKWRSSLAERVQSTSRSTSNQISPKASWTLQSHKGLISYHLSTGATTPIVTRPVLFVSFLDYWQVTLIWSPHGDASLIRSLLIGDTFTTYYTDVAIRVTMTLY